MVRYIYRKELQNYLLSKRLVIACVVLFLILIAWGVIFLTRHSRQIKEFDILQKKNVERLYRNEGEQRNLMEYFSYMRDPSRADELMEESEEYLKLTLIDLATMKQELYMPPATLSFVVASNGALPNGLQADAFTKNALLVNSGYNNYFSQFINLDLLNIVIYILSFICLCFAYDSFSGEKQQGTLKLTLSNGVARWQIVLGKLLALWTLLLAPLLLGLLINCMMVMLAPDVVFTALDACKLLIFIAFTALFLLINILIFFAVSLMTKTPRVSCSMCLLVWVLLVMVIPNSSWLLARRVHEVPSISEITLSETKQIKQLEDEFRSQKTGGFIWSDAWIGNPPHQGVTDYMEHCQEKIKIHNNLWGGYYASLFKQTDLASSMSKLSPFFIYRFFSENLIDNNYYGFRNFYNQVDQYQSDLMNYVIEKDATDPESYHLLWSDQERRSRYFISKQGADLLDIPLFKYRTPSVSELLSQTKLSILYMILWSLGLILFVFYRFAKYDVR